MESREKTKEICEKPLTKLSGGGIIVIVNDDSIVGIRDERGQTHEESQEHEGLGHLQAQQERGRGVRL